MSKKTRSLEGDHLNTDLNKNIRGKANCIPQGTLGQTQGTITKILIAHSE